MYVSDCMLAVVETAMWVKTMILKLIINPSKPERLSMYKYWKLVELSIYREFIETVADDVK